MVLRKPYAFLIKNFKKINFVLFLLFAYLLVRTINYSSFIKEYLSLGFYNPSILSVHSFMSLSFYLIVLLVIVLSLFSLVLLANKQRPYIAYIINIISVVYIMFAFYMGVNYFSNLGDSVINLQAIYLVRDLLNIAIVIEVVQSAFLFIRGIGLDLKKFGFAEDKEFLELSKADSEEFEVALEIDRTDLIRRFKTTYRHFNYFVREHKIIFSIISVVLVFTFGLAVYYNVYVLNRVYKMNEKFQSGAYNLKVNRAYTSNLDYRGEVIGEDTKNYIIVNFDVENITQEKIIMNIDRFTIINNENTYSPNKRQRTKFEDLGNFYDSQTLSPNVNTNFNLLFEVDKDFAKSDYALYYLEVSSNGKTKLRKIKISAKDITASEFVGGSKFSEPLKVNLMDDKSGSFSIIDYQIDNTFKYYFEQCRDQYCRVISRNLNANSLARNKHLMMVTFDSKDFSNVKMNDILVNYGKIIYIIDGKEYQSTSKEVISGDWRGNVVYMLVPEEMKTASEIKFLITLRENQYEYYLKES